MTKTRQKKASPSNDEPAEVVPGFDDLELHPSILESIREAGYTTPTPIQRDAIPLARLGRDIMGLAQTGTGKTAAFTLPIIDRLIDGPRRTRALILTPTRELCVQVDESFRKYAKHAQIAVVAVYGGVPLDPQEKKLRDGVDVVVATPGRLIDHLERQNVVFDDLEVLVLDEADRMLDMGFAPQINRIVDEIPKSTGRRCCSARPCRPRWKRSRASICASRWWCRWG
jgi:ATP-dependent RNA helicase RhlE